jgi:hypothetical protein
MPFVLVLLMSISVVVVSVLRGVPLPLLLYSRGGGGRVYKEENQVGYNMIPIRTLSLFAYSIYISMDIIIYALGSTSWSSRIF